MKSNIVIRSLDNTNIQYDWLEINLNTFEYAEGNSGMQSHSNHYNLSVNVSNEEYKRVKEKLVTLNQTLISVAN
ncbi:hypothetical protein [Staphylococcus gallinarum]|uniref:hypothetical protein n=1 Tax=Staphylococcus gallinarum TaxID=1293 RepID=UPI001E39F55E|nr:hypothetical protein [Staphylococcus gallinarum]MCD8845207.1 hypothetical protein [Staphylococcus gallinarum]